MLSARIHACLLVLTFVAVTAALRSQFFSGEQVGNTTDKEGILPGTSVGWQGGCERVTTNAQGRFRLPPSPKTNRIVASKPGYRIASAITSTNLLSLRLERLPTEDNDDYNWIDPHPDAAQPNNCGNCHGEIYREWRNSAHGNSATNPKFLQLFAGTDGHAAVKPTWNAQAEHPDGAAVCATCHAPTLTSPTLDYDIREAKGVARSGVHCDYCHKVADAPTDKLGTRFGRDGLYLLRPAKGELLTFGPLDDAVRPGESFGYLPVYKESRYCASCHEGIVFGVHAYSTYSEWLESPAKTQGKQCQDCHMAPTGKTTNIAPGHGGIERDPKTLASHHTPGGDVNMLKHCLTMTVETAGSDVRVEVMASRVGHRVPTGFVDRHLVLVVEALDEKGQGIELATGPRLPASVGPWKGLPGVLYAKQLIGENDMAPIPFWLRVLKEEDSRLFPDRPDQRTFRFQAKVSSVQVRLWYRRFWHEVAQSRGWRDNDILVAEKIISR